MVSLGPSSIWYFGRILTLHQNLKYQYFPEKCIYMSIWSKLHSDELKSARLQPQDKLVSKSYWNMSATDDIGNLPSIAVLDSWFKVVFNKKQNGKPNFVLQPPEFLVLMPPACSLWLGQSISTADESHQPGQLHLCRTRCYHGPQLPHGKSVQVIREDEVV